MAERNSPPSWAPDSSNGDTSLTDRVRALRLGDRLSNAKTGGGPAVWLPWLLCLLLAVAWVYLGSRWYGGGLSAPRSASKGETAIVEASPELVTPPAESTELTGTDRTVLPGKGYIIPARRVSISPIEVSGRIVELNIEEGKRVAAGFVLAQIDPTSFEADLKDAEAQRDLAKARYDELQQAIPIRIDRAHADLAEVEQQLQRLQLDYDRDYRLYSQGTLARSEFEATKFEFQATQERLNKFEQELKLLEKTRESQLAQVQAEWDAAEARVQRSRFRYDNCWIRAPINGTILTKEAELGNLINPVVGGISTSLCDMADLTELEVEIDVQERDLAKIHLDQACHVKTDAYPGEIFEAYVDRLMPIANRAKGAVPVRVKIIVPPDKDGKLKPEMGATVLFLDKYSDNTR